MQYSADRQCTNCMQSVQTRSKTSYDLYDLINEATDQQRRHRKITATQGLYQFCLCVFVFLISFPVRLSPQSTDC